MQKTEIKTYIFSTDRTGCCKL